MVRKSWLRTVGAVASNGGKRDDRVLWMDQSREEGFWGGERERFNNCILCMKNIQGYITWYMIQQLSCIIPKCFVYRCKMRLLLSNACGKTFSEFQPLLNLTCYRAKQRDNEACVMSRFHHFGLYKSTFSIMLSTIWRQCVSFLPTAF